MAERGQGVVPDELVLVGEDGGRHRVVDLRVFRVGAERHGRVLPHQVLVGPAHHGEQGAGGPLPVGAVRGRPPPQGGRGLDPGQLVLLGVLGHRGEERQGRRVVGPVREYAAYPRDDFASPIALGGLRAELVDEALCPVHCLWLPR
ncbi:hypothetical protein [Streptomyces sp. NBC_00304]|uniref:hypothetical protein n=1 Tax=Streptomyces sp. NBC_00304 TaxID=2975706 RepID=UPI002E28166C|nr:hypothetical protein [Streptomyces sp. NBC_00304]